MKLPHNLVLMLQMLGSLGRIPAFNFKKSLFFELIRKGLAKNKIDSDDEEPQVVFTKGPIDGVLGSYSDNNRKRRIVVDVLEIYIICLKVHLERNGKGNIREEFDLEVTRVLAHEGGHWHLDRKYGIWPVIERFLLRILFIGIGLVGGVFLLYSVSIFLIETAIPFLFGINQLVGILWSVSLVLLTLLLGVEIICRYWAFVSMISHLLTYKICYDERFAREFEKRPNNDPRWDEVIVVSDEED